MRYKIYLRPIIYSLLVAFWIAVLANEGICQESKRAAFSAYIDESGRAQIGFTIFLDAPLSREQEQTLSDALGYQLERFSWDDSDSEEEDAEEQQEKASEEKTPHYYYTAQGEQRFNRSGWGVEGDIKFDHLLAPLRSLGITELMVSVTHAQFGYSACTPSSEKISLAEAGFDYHTYQVSVDEPLITGAHFSFGYSYGQLLKKSWPFAAMFMLPVLLTLWLRRSISKSSVDPASASMWILRVFNLLSFAVPILWMAAFYTSEMGQFFEFLFNTRNSVFRMPVNIGLYTLPPGAIMLLCSALLQPALDRMRGEETRMGESLRRASAMFVAEVVPLLLALTAFNALITGSVSLGIAALCAAYIVRRLSLPVWAKATGINPQVLVAHDLRARIFELADLMGVKLQQVYVIPTGNRRLANAFAASGNKVLLTEEVLRKFSRREVDAVVGHELAHLKHSHPRITGLASLLTLLLPSFFVLLPGFFGRSIPILIVFPIGIVMAFLMFFFLSRWFEYTADAESVALTSDPEAMITALVRLGRLNYLPANWSRFDEKLLTHPSTLRRARAIAKANNIADYRLDALMNSPDAEAECYSLTAALPIEGATENSTQPAARSLKEKSRPKVFLLIEFVVIGLVIGFFLSRPGVFLRPILDRAAVPSFLFVIAAGLLLGCWRSFALKRKLLRVMPGRVKFLPASIERFPGVDVEAMERCTRELESLGFERKIDCTVEFDVKQSGATFGRLFAHGEHHCFAEVGQVIKDGISMIPVQCGMMSSLEGGWFFSSGNTEINAYTYPHRQPRRLWTAHPGASPAALLQNHLAKRKEIAERLGVNVKADISVDAYFAEQEEYFRERKREFKRKSMFIYFLDIDLFERKPKCEWMGDYPKIAGKRMPGRELGYKRV